VAADLLIQGLQALEVLEVVALEIIQELLQQEQPIPVVVEVVLEAIILLPLEGQA